MDANDRHAWIDKRQEAGLCAWEMVRLMSRIVVKLEPEGYLSVDCSALYPEDTLWPTCFPLEPDESVEGYWSNPMVEGSGPLPETLLMAAMLAEQHLEEMERQSEQGEVGR